MFAKLVVLWFGSRASEKKVPNWVLRLPLRTREAFVDGYYRGDGYNPTNHGKFVVNGKYKVGSCSQLLVDDIMSMGLISGFHCISKAIGDPESFLTWSSDAAQTYRMTKRPPPELLVRTEHVQSFAKTAFYSSHRKNPSRYRRVNRMSVETYKPEFEHFYKGNCHFEKIKEIIIVGNELPVYDISVRGSESFFNADGLLLSNSLYPSLIKVHNLSYETVNCGHPECRTNLVPDTTHWVCTRRKGITSLVVGSLRDLRVSHYKPLARDPTLGKDDRELYNIVSQGLKVYLNASYGIFGFETFALYCLPVAEATAALGRDAITKTIDKCQNLGISVIYSDTDSVHLQNPSKEQILTVTQWASGELGVELDLDKVYRYIAFSSRKKNYFGVLVDGTVDIRGLTGKKSQTPEFLKKVFFESLDILRSVYSSTDFENARARIRELLTTMIGNLKSREIPMQELAFNVMMGKPTASYKDNTPQHVKAAELLQKNGREIKAGEIISFVKTKTPPFVKPVDLAKPDEIDVEKYVDYARSMFDQMLDALDFSFDEIMGATTLDLFWS
jgi:DNA polymerase elongation subunit (family B)